MEGVWVSQYRIYQECPVGNSTCHTLPHLLTSMLACLPNSRNGIWEDGQPTEEAREDLVPSSPLVSIWPAQAEGNGRATLKKWQVPSAWKRSGRWGRGYLQAPDSQELGRVCSSAPRPLAKSSAFHTSCLPGPPAPTHTRKKHPTKPLILKIKP